MIDWTRVVTLHAEVGAAEFRPLLELFLDEIEGVMMSVSPADPAALEEKLHFLKGCAWNLGLRAFGSLCELWEALVIRGGGEALDLAQLFSCYGQSKQMLMRDLDRLLAGGQADVA